MLKVGSGHKYVGVVENLNLKSINHSQKLNATAIEGMSEFF